MVRLHTQPGNDLHPGDQVGGHRVHRPQDDHQQDQLGRVDRKAAQQGQARQDQQQSQGIRQRAGLEQLQRTVMAPPPSSPGAGGLKCG